MKVLIEEISTGHFIGAKNQWVQSKAHARAFRNSGAAIKFCLGRTLPDVRLLVSFDNPAHDFYLYPFGRDELMSRTQRVLAHNTQLQQRQWALTAELGTALAHLRRTRKRLPIPDTRSNDSRMSTVQSAA